MNRILLEELLLAGLLSKIIHDTCELDEDELLFLSDIMPTAIEVRNIADAKEGTQ